MRLNLAVRQSTRLSLTPLIDVIFLLLLFFMLSSTFSKFAEIELAGAEGGMPAATSSPVFVQLRGEDILVNGVSVAFDELRDDLQQHADTGAELALVSMDEAVTSQRFVDVYAMVRAIEALRLAIVN